MPPKTRTNQKVGARNAKAPRAARRPTGKGPAPRVAAGTKRPPAKRAADRKPAQKKSATRPARDQAAEPPKKAAGAASPKKSAGAAVAPTALDASALARLSDLRSPTDPPAKPTEQRGAGLRGAAPWVARHAAKHAAELRARNAEPPPPGSARATLRVPIEAEQIKARIAQLHQQTTRIRALCRRLDKNFYEVGQLLADIQQQDLHVAKGYSSFEAFLDRELEIGRAQALRLVRIAHTFLREMAYDYGLERLTQALAALDGELAAASPSQPSNRSFSSPGLPARPPIRFAE